MDDPQPRTGSGPTELTPGGINAVGHMLGLLGDEWSLLVMQQALLGATRYGQFMSRLPISNSVLTRRLGTLTADGLLARHRYQERPPRDEYLVTARGRALWPILLSIWEWERRWVPEQRRALPGMRHALCGRDFSPLLSCSGCGQDAVAGEVMATWGPSGGWQRSLPVATTRRRSGSGSTTDGRDSPSGLFPQTMSVLGNRWACAILVAAFTGTTRFSEFQKLLAAPPGSVSDRLARFRENGIMTTSRERPEYLLTAKGEAFLPVLVTALQWAQSWFASPEGPAVHLAHTTCEQAFHPILRCDRCKEPLTGNSVLTT